MKYINNYIDIINSWIDEYNFISLYRLFSQTDITTEYIKHILSKNVTFKIIKDTFELEIIDKDLKFDTESYIEEVYDYFRMSKDVNETEEIIIQISSLYNLLNLPLEKSILNRLNSKEVNKEKMCIESSTHYPVYEKPLYYGYIEDFFEYYPDVKNTVRQYNAFINKFRDVYIIKYGHHDELVKYLLRRGKINSDINKNDSFLSEGWIKISESVVYMNTKLFSIERLKEIVDKMYYVGITGELCYEDVWYKDIYHLFNDITGF